ncbi:MAG: VanZ family protein [Bacteroidetes bacterium]|nr:VanZ family protein [Bacteroidota bacterium]
MKLNHKAYTFPTLVLGIFILGLCVLPGSAVPEVGWQGILGLDKWVHSLLYGAWIYVYMNYGGNKPYLALLLMFLYGGAIELIQEYLLQYRSGEWADWVADGIGLVLGLIAYSQISRKRKVSSKTNV